MSANNKSAILGGRQIQATSGGLREQTNLFASRSNLTMLAKNAGPLRDMCLSWAWEITGDFEGLGRPIIVHNACRIQNKIDFESGEYRGA